MDWIEGLPSTEGVYWVHDSVNGVLFAMVTKIMENGIDGWYYYIMGCDLGFPVEQLTHYIPVKPPAAPPGALRMNVEE